MLGVCLVCDAPASKRDDLVSCSACGFAVRVAEDGILAAPFDASEVAYPQDASDLLFEIEDESFWFRHRNRVLAVIVERFPFEGRLWDVGGGNGYQARLFESSGRAVALVEPSIAACRNARARGVSVVVNATLGALKIPDGRVGAVALLDVIEHLADPGALLAEARRICRPGARLYATVPAHPWLWSEEDVIAKHRRRYTRSSLVAELESAGFSVELATHYFRPLVAPTLLLRSLPHRVGLRRRAARAGTTDARDHAPPGAARRIVDALLERELGELSRGRTLSRGTSLVAVAKARGGSS